MSWEVVAVITAVMFFALLAYGLWSQRQLELAKAKHDELRLQMEEGAVKRFAADIEKLSSEVKRMSLTLNVSQLNTRR